MDHHPLESNQGDTLYMSLRCPLNYEGDKINQTTRVTTHHKDVEKVFEYHCLLNIQWHMIEAMLFSLPFCFRNDRVRADTRVQGCAHERCLRDERCFMLICEWPWHEQKTRAVNKQRSYHSYSCFRERNERASQYPGQRRLLRDVDSSERTR